MRGHDRLFGAGIGLLVVAGVAWWVFVAYVAYRLLSHFGII